MNTLKHLVLFVLLFISVPARTQGQTDSLLLSTRKEGPFLVGQRKVLIEIATVHFPPSIRPDFPKTESSIIIRDSASNVVLRRNYPSGMGEFQMTFGFDQTNIPSIGNVLLWSRSVVPSAPGSGNDIQVICLNSVGQIVSLTGVIETERFKIVHLVPSKGPVPVHHNEPQAEPFVESEDWTGYFTVLRYYRIYKSGDIYDRGFDFNFRFLPVRIDAAQARKYRNADQRGAFNILLYPKPQANNQPTKNLVIQPTSTIRFLDAVRRERWWLHVVIDGIEGFVEEKEFAKLGLPPAG